MREKIKELGNYIKGLFGYKPLSEEYIKELGFKKTYSKSHYVYFTKGKLNVKWDFHVDHALVTVKWGKGLRFFGNVETEREFKSVVDKLDKYFA